MCRCGATTALAQKGLASIFLWSVQTVSVPTEKKQNMVQTTEKFHLLTVYENRILVNCDIYIW